MASHGHLRRCCLLPFLGSPRRLVLASLPCFSPIPGCGVVASVWAFSCCELGETARLRSFVFVAVFRFSGHVADGVGRWFAVSGGWRRRVVVLAFTGSRVPCPLGRGIICGLRGIVFVCGEGVGGIVEVLPVSLLVVVSSHHLRRHRLSVCLLRCPPRYHLPRAPCVLSSPISAPCASFSSSLPLLCLFLPPPCSRVVSYRFSPRSFDEPGGAFFACLPRSLRLLSRRPVFLTRFARAPCLLALRVIVLRRPRFRSSSPSPLLVSRRVPVCRLSPFFDKRGRGGCRVVLACLSRRFALVLGCGSPVVRVCGLSSSADGGRRGRWLLACPGMAEGGVVSAGCCVWFVVSLFVYINWVLARV